MDNTEIEPQVSHDSLSPLIQVDQVFVCFRLHLLQSLAGFITNFCQGLLGLLTDPLEHAVSLVAHLRQALSRIALVTPQDCGASYKQGSGCHHGHETENKVQFTVYDFCF